MRKLSNEELGRLSVEEFKSEMKTPIAVVLDNVRSMNNVGSAFRTADAFLIEKLYLCGITGTPPHRDIQKTAIGAQESVAWEHCTTTLDAIKELKERDWEIISVEQADESVMLNDFHPEEGKKYAFVFGNEVFGVDEEVVQSSDAVLEIPQFGTKHSLNISVSMGVVLWEVFSKMKLT
ncbi:MAG: RNA methyltransferase [Cytophagales bacterium]|nr:RNA methyltransferase [Cytophagales bacterium]